MIIRRWRSRDEDQKMKIKRRWGSEDEDQKMKIRRWRTEDEEDKIKNRLKIIRILEDLQQGCLFCDLIETSSLDLHH